MPAKRRGSGEGSIRRRKDGRWQGALRYIDPISGLAKRAYVYGRTRSEALDELHAIRARVGKGKGAKPQRILVADYLTYWLDNIAKPSVRASTLRAYRGMVDNHLIPLFGSMQLSALRPAAIQELMVAKSSSRSHAMALAVLRRALDQAKPLGLLDDNPAAHIKAPRVGKKEMRVLSPQEVRALLEAAHGDRLYALYFLAIYTGMRQGELLALRWSDVDLQNARITVARTLDAIARTVGAPKTATSRRVIDLGPNAVAALRAHREVAKFRNSATALVFTDRDGGTLRASNLIRRSFHPLLERAKLKAAKQPSPIRFHDLRHTAATLMLGAGVHPKVVSERLGHASVTITMDLYQHVLPSLQRDAAAAIERALEGGRNGGQGDSAATETASGA